MTTDQLLERTAALLFFGGQWHARARDSNTFAVGATPREAMERALGSAPPDLEELFG